jgi:hypothetical protein
LIVPVISRNPVTAPSAARSKVEERPARRERHVPDSQSGYRRRTRQRTMQEQEENRSKKYDDLPGGTRTRPIARYIRANTVALALIFQRTVGALCTAA